MKALGFDNVPCGVDGPDAWRVAEEWERRWQAARRGLPPREGPLRLAGSLGEAYDRYRKTNTWKEKKLRTREDWERGWKHIEPFFADVAPATVTLEHVDSWYAALLEKVGMREAHRAMKIWRALWRVAGSMKYCDKDKDPSLGIRRKTPIARSDIWHEGEAVRLIKEAWRKGYCGLAAAMAVSWDTQLSPVDVRSLTAAQRAKDAQGAVFFHDRTKTGRAAAGTLGRRAERVLDAYLDGLGVELHADAPLFRNRSGRPYSKDTLGDDFREIRRIVFPGDKRTLMDFRRSGAVEALAGDVDPAALAAKMAKQHRPVEGSAAHLPAGRFYCCAACRRRATGRPRHRLVRVRPIRVF